MSQGPRPNLYYSSALTTAAGETTIDDGIYIEDGTQGIVVDVYHTSAGSGTVTYKIQAMPYTSDQAAWLDTTPVTMLTSTAVAKDTNVRLVVDPRVTAVANTHAQTVLPWRVKITATAATADATAVFVSLTQCE